MATGVKPLPVRRDRSLALRNPLSSPVLRLWDARTPSTTSSDGAPRR